MDRTGNTHGMRFRISPPSTAEARIANRSANAKPPVASARSTPAAAKRSHLRSGG